MMIVTPIKTRKIMPGSLDIKQLLDKHILELEEKSILVITSKVVSLCMGRVVPKSQIPKDALVAREADLYLPRRFNKWNFELSIIKRTMVMSAGIDESNSGGDYYVLWPEDPQSVAMDVWRYLKKRFSLKEVGVIITDSTCTPLRWGTTGVAIAYCGFKPRNSYVGRPDLFGRKLKVSNSNVAGGLAAAAVVCMGEGDEQTPLAVIKSAPFVNFQPHVPTKTELDGYFISGLDEDVFAPLLNSVEWREGGHGTP